MRRIVTTSFGLAPWGYGEIADEVLVLPAVVPLNSTKRGRKNAIKQAMIAVVEAANPGDVCCQDDIEFTRDPWESPLEAGHVTLLTNRQSELHACPRAFRFGDIQTGQAIVDQWLRCGSRCCYGWTKLPMIEHLAGRHM